MEGKKRKCHLVVVEYSQQPLIGLNVSAAGAAAPAAGKVIKSNVVKGERCGSTHNIIIQSGKIQRSIKGEL